MATSQNRWAVHTTSANMKPFPWITGRVLPGDVFTILDYVAQEFDRRVEKIRKADSWGYAYRPIRGKSSGFSNHASGTAIDLNATTHPLGKSNTFSKGQQATIRAIISPLNGVVRWGGDYAGGRKDDMHFELNVPPGDPRIRQAVKWIEGRNAVKPPATGGWQQPDSKPTPTPQPTQPQQEDDVPKVIEKTFEFQHGGGGWQVTTEPLLQTAKPIAAMHLVAKVHGPEGHRLVTRWVSWVPGKGGKPGFWDRRAETVHASHRTETEHVGFTVDGNVQIHLDTYTTKPGKHWVSVSGIYWEA